ncbi:P-loop containing nucleoside triphosphate hydrolase protein [Zopfia rhizophila CBS 207.26]|uniref:dTMP kinase n=1 Tax=Zopfia rhizophila CBS 207.26 TaxID=1314779 RepID=A0A6A6EM03_9PEZI|nr:P-loop containing nucleoside triphosphate hydrolase protein [Zopfia rhizophila CBS 207.26]
MLVEGLQKDGISVRHMRFPDRTTPIGQMINGYLSGQSEQEDHVIHLLFSANRWEAAASIQAGIAAGTTIVIDRYYYSGCVYSAAKRNPTLDLVWAHHPEEGLPRPDFCVFLDISAEDAAKRGGFGTEKYEKKEMQDNVRDLFNTMMSSSMKDDFVRIEAGGPLKEVQQKVREAVLKAMDKVDTENLPLRFVAPW